MPAEKVEEILNRDITKISVAAPIFIFITLFVINVVIAIYLIMKIKKYKSFALSIYFWRYRLTVIEALANGTSVVMFKTFTSASFYEKCGAVTLIEPKDFDSFNKAINNIMNLNNKEWIIKSKMASLFAKENFDRKIFKKKGTDYIETFIK